MSMSQAILGEFNHEAVNTRKMLEAVPEERFGWQPHEKSMTLSRLAGHIAEIPGWAAQMVGKEEFDMGGGNYQPVQPETVAELLQEHDRSVAAFQQALDGADDATLLRSWVLKSGGEVLLQMPCIAAMRGFVLSHVVHHRGQLSVFLRLLDVPLPQVYGPTADNQGF